MIWRKKPSSSESEDSDNCCSEEEKLQRGPKPAVRLKQLSATPPSAATGKPRKSSRKPNLQMVQPITKWDVQVRARAYESQSTGLGIEVARQDPTPDSIILDAQEARHAEMQRQIRTDEVTDHERPRKAKKERRREREISREMSREMSREVRQIDRDARQKTREIRHKDREVRRQLRRAERARRHQDEQLAGAGTDARRNSSETGRRHANRKSATRRNTGSSRGAESHAEIPADVTDSPLPFETSSSGCRAALRHAERQREYLMEQINQHRLEQLEQALQRAKRPEISPQQDADDLSRKELRRIRRQKRREAREGRRTEGELSRARETEAETPRESSREARESSRESPREIPRQARETPREVSRDSPRGTSRVSRPRQQTPSPPAASPETHPETSPIESPLERALRYVRAAERDRQRVLLQTPPDIYHTRIQPPPRDEYSTVDEDIPPYRAQLHKYLDLVLYDERFTPILRVNRYLVNGDSELTAAIDKLTQFNLLPKRTNLWSISHIDDNDYEEMIPVLIPEHSYHGNELALF